MNIETVNELIASLESAGELSIREQKFLKLAKEFRICSASLDAAIKTGNMLADQNAQLAAENVALKNAFGPGDSVLNFLTIALRTQRMTGLTLMTSRWLSKCHCRKPPQPLVS